MTQKKRKPPRCEYRVELKLRYGVPQTEEEIRDFLWEILREHVNVSRTDGGLIGAYTLDVHEKLKASDIIIADEIA